MNDQDKLRIYRRPFTFIVVLAFLSIQAFAQKADSIFVVPDEEGWLIRHKVKAGETIFDLARRYHVPPAMISDVNDISYQQQLQPDSRLFIPLGAYNFITAKPVQQQETRPVYFRVNKDISLQRIARNTSVSQKTIQQWNNLEHNELYRGQVLLVGWVLYDNTDINRNKVILKPDAPPAVNRTGPGLKVQEQTDHRPIRRDTIYITGQDTISSIRDTMEVSEGEQQYMLQTSDGMNVAEEKGTAAFFKRAGRSTNGIYFAFHNVAKRGTIIKIYNPGTQKVVYAKVIGKLPGTGTFHNALIGISSDARTELEAGGEKLWCEISYAP